LTGISNLENGLGHSGQRQRLIIGVNTASVEERDYLEIQQRIPAREKEAGEVITGFGGGVDEVNKLRSAR
jgi:hypothetical protein